MPKCDFARNMPFESTNALPADLEDIALATFDRLVGNSEIHYSLPKVEVIQIDGLQVIHIVPLILLLAENCFHHSIIVQ